MSDQSIEISALYFLCQLKVLFGHFEKDFDVPTFTEWEESNGFTTNCKKYD